MENPISTEDRIVLSTIEAIEKYGIRGATNRRIAAMAKHRAIILFSQ